MLVNTYDAVIVGGGLAGLTAANHLASRQRQVLVIEKNPYPLHKVCGEYLSKEVLPYLQSLGISLKDAVNIDRLELSHRNGNILRTDLPLGGLGISRYALDDRLYQSAVQKGVQFIFKAAESIEYKEDLFEVQTLDGKKYEAHVVIGAFGKRSSMDKTLDRDFIQKKAPWLGVKAHYSISDFPDNLVGLHSFEGGYGGLSKTESGAVNFCYLATYKSFKPYGVIESYHNQVIRQNPYLDRFLQNAEPIFEKPLSIAQISFRKKEIVKDHMLMCGDSAGLIHPLCGNGMAMAIHSAQIASQLILEYLENPEINRSALEKGYRSEWQSAFSSRLRMGRILQSLLLNQSVASGLIRTFTLTQGLTKALIRRTHGKTIQAI